MTDRARLAALVGAALLAGWLAAPAPVRSHPLGPSLLELRALPFVAGEGSAGVEAGSADFEAGAAAGEERSAHAAEGAAAPAVQRWAVRWRSARAAPDTPRLPAWCRAATAARAVLDADADYVERRWEVVCAAPGLAGARIAVAGPRASRRDALVVVAYADGAEVRGLLSAADAGWTVPPRASGAGVLRAHVGIGLRHLLTGADHVLFVLGLVGLVAGQRRLLLAVSGFTAGHAVTLALAAVGAVRVPVALAEAAIAATLVALALELAERAERGTDAQRSWLARRPAAMAGAFGLLHGLGFARVLRDAGLPAAELPAALAGFHLGIEAGQLAVVGAALVAGAAARRAARRLALAPSVRARLALAPARALGVLGVFWGLDRLL